MSDSNKLRAARDQLKAEREQIIEAAIEAGTAIRVPVSITQHGGDIEEVKQRLTEELRRKGEKREIFFDECTIFTGVPRAPGYFQRSGTKVDQPPEEPRTRPDGQALRASDDFRAQDHRPPQADAPTTEPRRVRATIKLPDDTSPQGEIAEGSYQVVGDDMVLVRDARGNPLGRVTLKPGEDPEAAARQLLKSKTTGSSNFWGPLQYPPNSIH